MTAQEVASELRTDPKRGLKRFEARRRRSLYGLNKLRRAKRVSALKLLADQFKSLVVLLLAGAAVISFVISTMEHENYLESLAIGVVVLLNAGIGFVVELRANRAMEALQKLGVQQTVVVRGGRRLRVNAHDLVPGDIVEFEAGDSITADCRLVEAPDLRVVESALTGESVPVDKNTLPVEDANAGLGDRTCMLYKGTTAVSGSSRAIVTATGMATEVGRIAELVSKAEDEETPLEVRLRSLGRALILIVLVIAAIVIAAGLLTGKKFDTMVMTGIALAIAAVPEGLPAVATISLAVGMRRMARRNALIRRLPAVETLGSAGVICTDKTGTLTRNEMTAVRYHLAGGPVEVGGTGYAPEGEFIARDARLDPARHEPLLLALECGALCSNSSLVRNEESGEWDVTGDPTEGALVVAAAKAGIDQAELRRKYEQIKEYPFSSEAAMMATVHKNPDGGTITFVKGAPDRIYELCTAVHTVEGVCPMDEAFRGEFGKAQDAMADDALRVLGLAYKKEDQPGEPYKDLVLVGLVGLLDPPRNEVAEAIRRFKEAGIRTVMITGDHPRTALAIGRMLGITEDSEEAVIAGRELHGMTEQELAERVDRISVYARVSPEDKVKIVDALQDKGNVVAMLGDGVNDAAALKEADIGVAMGIKGTDVAKETSDIVLLDDRFVTVNAAVAEGRKVLANIKKFIHYLFSCNLSEVMTVFLGTITGLPLPLLALQILWLNLVTDVLPALSLAMEPAEPGLMHRPPRPPAEPILSKRLKHSVAGYSLLITAATLGSFFWALYARDQRGSTREEAEAVARTVCFMTIALSQLFHAWNSRKDSDPITGLRDFFANRYIVGAAVLTIGLQLAAIYVPGLNRVLKTRPLAPSELGMVFAFSAFPLAAGQAIRWIARIRKGTSTRE